MPYNAIADIHQWTWYDYKGKKLLCTCAGWSVSSEDPETWVISNIQLLEFMTCTPVAVETEKMIQLLTSGQMKVIKSPFWEDKKS